jgi:hypothetical protein
MISERSIVVASRSQVSCELEGEAVMLNLKDGVYYGLNPVGAHIWKLIREPKQVREVVNILLETYDVEPERCTREVLTLLQDLAARGLVEVQDAVGS